MTNLYFQMLRIRRVEEALAREYSKQEMRQPVHLDIGAEWASVAVCSQLESYDEVYGTHRSHSQYLACSGDLKSLIAELYGKSTGCTNGIGGSMHLKSEGIFKASGSIVGGMIPVAVGAAWAKKLKGEEGIVVCFLGDGATEEGVWTESLSFSVLHELPILFVIQNNKLAVTTPIEDRHRYDIMEVCKAYGLGTAPSINSLEEAVSTLELIIPNVRDNKPFAVEFMVERERVHCGIEHEYILQNDFLKGYTIDESKIQLEIQEAFEFARKSPTPTNVRGVYSD